jgi:hypothetical protein
VQDIASGGFGSPSPFGKFSPRVTARFAGGLYLTYIAATVLATYLRSTLINGDAATTTQNIVANSSVLRIAFVTDVFSGVLFFLAAWALFVLLRPVNVNYAIAFLLLNLAGVAVQCANTLNLFASLQVLTDSSYQAAFSASQVQAMAMNDIHLYNNGFMIAQIFFGAWLFPLGYLVYKSRFIPRAIGVLLLVDGFAVLFWFAQYFLIPSYSLFSDPGLAVSFIAEFGLAVWLVIKAVPASPQFSPDQGGTSAPAR